MGHKKCSRKWKSGEVESEKEQRIGGGNNDEVWERWKETTEEERWGDIKLVRKNTRGNRNSVVKHKRNEKVRNGTQDKEWKW